MDYYGPGRIGVLQSVCDQDHETAGREEGQSIPSQPDRLPRLEGGKICSLR